MRVATIYEPVQKELDQVEASIRQVQRNDIPWLEEMLGNAFSSGGKRLRPTIALLAGRFGEHRPDRLVPLAASIELLHTATLVHDDVIDASDTRRGQPTANFRYKNAAAVMLGDYMFAHAANMVCQAGRLEVVKLFSRTLLSMASGELTQDMSAYEYGQDTMDYFRRIAGKTASLFAASGEGGAMVAEAPDDWISALREFGTNVGMAFQIVDDILDFCGDEAEMGKPVGGDLLQGTLTLPALILMERRPDDNPVKKLFDNKRQEEHLAEAIYLIQNSDILDESYRVAEDFRDRALAALEPLPDAPHKAALADLANFVTERRS